MICDFDQDLEAPVALDMSKSSLDSSLLTFSPEENLKLECLSSAMNDKYTYKPIDNELVQAYIRNDLSSIFDSNPNSKEDWLRKAEEVQSQKSNIDWKGADALNKEKGLPSPSKTKFKIHCGQQIRLLCGPVFLYYKCLTTLGIKRRLEKWGIEAGTIFWSENEDDDWDELRNSRWLSRNLEIVKTSLKESKERKMMNQYSYNEPSGSLSEIFNHENPSCSWTESFIKGIRESFENKNFVSANEEYLIKNYLSELEMSFVPSNLSSIKESGSKILSKFVKKHQEITKSITRAHRKMKDLGFDVPFKTDPKKLNVFELKDGKRYRINIEEDSAVSESGNKWKLEDLSQEIENDPSSFGPNVTSRTIIKDYVFNGIAVVVGPGEIAYRALFQEVYDMLGVIKPIIIPRYTASIVPEKYSEIIETIDDFQLIKKDSRKASEKYGMTKNKSLLDEFENFQKKTGESSNSFLEKLSKKIPSIKPMAERVEKQLSSPLEKLKSQTFREIEPSSTNQINELKKILWPEGKPQERMLSIPAIEYFFNKNMKEYNLLEKFEKCKDRQLIIYR